MSALLTIKLTAPARNAVRDLLTRMEPAKLMTGLNAARGKAAEGVVKAHFLTRPRNARGWKSSGFWNVRMRTATSLTHFDASTATVTIADPAMNQKVHGGPITPKEGKVLCIPARSEAAGRSPRTFPGLQYIPLRGRGKLVGLLVMPTGRKFSQGGKLDVYFFCLSHVTQFADKDALPARAAFVSALSAATEGHITRALRTLNRAEGIV